MLLLDLNTIRAPHERFEREYSPEQLGAADDFTVAAPVSLAFDIYKDQDQFRVVGDVKTILELPCSRCLEAFTLPVAQSFDLRYQPKSRNTGEGEREIEEDDLTTAYYADEAIDLGDLMREQFYLALPMKPLCREECKGLCPQCGANLNTTTCTCTRDWDDPRLAALRALKKDS
jgi:DUF177 domain-containing protein